MKSPVVLKSRKFLQRSDLVRTATWGCEPLHTSWDQTLVTFLIWNPPQTIVPGARSLVTNDVLFHEPARHPAGRRHLHRHNIAIDEAGFRRERHADRYLKPPGEMARLFARYPEAVARTIEIAGRCAFSMDELRVSLQFAVC